MRDSASGAHDRVHRTLLSAQYADRAAAPADVLDWQAFSTWRDAVWELLSDTIDGQVRNQFVTSPPKYLVSDDLTWLDEIIWTVREEWVDIKSLLAERLGSRFKAVRAAHGTRTDDVASFYRNGLLPLDPPSVHEQARSIFLGGTFPELTSESLEKAIAVVGTNLREGRLYFEANEKNLIEYGGHYMLYGSEYLTAIAANLDGHRDYRRALQAYGKATLFVCDVPLSLVRDGTIIEFAGSALEFIFQEVLDGNDFTLDWTRGASFSIDGPLPPNCIVGHYHPDVRRDPFRPETLVD